MIDGRVMDDGNYEFHYVNCAIGIFSVSEDEKLGFAWMGMDMGMENSGHLHDSERKDQIRVQHRIASHRVGWCCLYR